MENNVIKTLSDLFNAMKVKFYNFVNDVILNLNTIEGIILAVAINVFPNHAQEISNFFATYLSFKPNK